MFLSKASDFSKHPRIDILGYADDRPEETSTIGVLNFDRENDGFADVNIYPEGTRILEEYSGVGYRLIQALIEYALNNNAKNIVARAIPEYLHFYSKAGFRVNPQKDKFIAKNSIFIKDMLRECDNYGLPKEQFMAALKERTKDGKAGYGKYETLETLNKLLYLKNKYLFYPCAHIPLELTPQAKEEWLERIKLQPILSTIRK